MIKIFLFLTLSLITNSVFSQDFVKKLDTIINQKSHKPTNDSENKKNIKIKTFKIDQGWGFDILVNNKNYIHQPNIPAISGQKVFKTKNDALKIARLMKSKIRKNIFPPSVTLQEIDSLISKN